MRTSTVHTLIRLHVAACIGLAMLGGHLDPVSAKTLPALPQQLIDTTYAPPNGTTWLVSQGDDLQGRLNAAQPGDLVVLEAGATFTGNFTLPAKSGAGWIYVQSSALASLPAPGNRVNPSQAGSMAAIVSPNTAPALSTAPGAHHFRFIGLRIATAWATTSGTATNVVDLDAGGVPATDPSQLPNNIVFDRCYIHGTATGSVRRGVLMNGASIAVVDSYLSDFHDLNSDSQALAGWAGPGPFKVVNNYLEGATENLMFGGDDPRIANLVPSDIEIRRNHFFKPPSWQGVWPVKNILELKNAQRVLIEGNVLENNWVGGQIGFAVVFTVRNQEGAAPWSIVQDVTFRLNIVRNTPSGVNMHGSDNNFPSQETNRILIQNNLFDGLGGGGRIIFVGNGTTEPSGFGVLNLGIEHNTLRLPDNGDFALGFGDNMQPANQSQCYYRSNVTQHGRYGVFGTAMGEGTSALDQYCVSPYVFTNNVLIGAPAGLYPTGNFFPANDAAVGFVDAANGNYALAASSPYKNQGTDGRDPGADFVALNAATANVITGGGGGPTPFHGAPIALPGTIEAEDFDLGGEGVAYHDNVPGNAGGQYRLSEDVDIIASTDSAGGGYTVWNFETGEWMIYTVTVASSGNYDIAIRASNDGPESVAFHVEIDGVNVTGSVPVSRTGSWNTFQWVTRTDVPLTAGQHRLKLVSDHQYFNVNQIRVMPSPAPFHGAPIGLPGVIEAEDFDLGGEGVAYHDNVPGNSGGQYRPNEDVDIIVSTDAAGGGYTVWNLGTGEWMIYTVTVASSGSYDIAIRVSNFWPSDPVAFHVEIDDVNVTGRVPVSMTQDWNDFQWVTTTGIPLTAGRHRLKLVADQQWFNVNQIRVTASGP